MCFNEIAPEIIIRGTVLAIEKRLFPEGIPTLNEFCQESGVAASTFWRAADWLLGVLPGIFQSHRPGPQTANEPASSDREDTLRKLEDLRAWLVNQRAETATNNCYSPEAKQRIATFSEEAQRIGILSFGEISGTLGIDERHLRRIREEVKAASGAAPEAKSRRPKQTNELAREIQELIQKIERCANSKQPYTATAIQRILEKNYKAELLQHHGAETIALDTVSRYMGKESVKEETPRDHPRGKYRYAEPFQQVAIDTSHFKFFGKTYYLITVFEMAGRLNLTSRIFLRENTAAVVRVLEEFLAKYPGVEVVVIDRGSPYLNEEVKGLLEANGKLRVVAPPATPEAKAACERHFSTLKEVLRQAIASVFSEDPGWEPEKVAKMLELGVAVFQPLYHQIPQEGIDGKTPAERIASFDPVRACAMQLELFERALASEPAAEYARELYKRFQLPGTEEEAVKRLRPFGTAALRQAEREVEKYMGPPKPKWMYDPVGFLAARARRIWEKRERAFLEEKLRQEKEKKKRQDEKQHREAALAGATEREEHPERFVDAAFEQLVRCVESGFQGGVRIMAKQLKELLFSFSRKLGRGFRSEVIRLRERIQSLSGEAAVRNEVEDMLVELINDWQANE